MFAHIYISLSVYINALFLIKASFQPEYKISNPCSGHWDDECWFCRQTKNATRDQYTSYLVRVQDSLLKRTLERGTYKKLDSYHYLINGFFVLINPPQVLAFQFLDFNWFLMVVQSLMPNYRGKVGSIISGICVEVSSNLMLQYKSIISWSVIHYRLAKYFCHGP